MLKRLLPFIIFFSFGLYAQSQFSTAVLEGAFILESKSSGLVLDVPGGSTDNGVQLHQWERNDTSAQQFSLMPVSGGLYKIVNVGNGKALEIDINRLADDGGKVQQADFEGKFRQLWIINEVEMDYYKIVNYASKKALDVAEFSREPGGLIQQWTDSGGANQRWKFIPVQP
jgi:hypothetical protein